MRTTHAWRFFRAGGFDQVRLDSGADLASLDQLDQKLWVALACPTTGLEFDSRTLALMDTDKDGRIRAPELIAAAEWVCGLLKEPQDLLKSAPSLPLTLINDASAEGRQLLASARQILVHLGKAEADATILPLGEGTTAAASSVKAVKSKVEDYFTRCRLAAFDPRAIAALNRRSEEHTSELQSPCNLVCRLL